jgi:hypothetical protein
MNPFNLTERLNLDEAKPLPLIALMTLMRQSSFWSCSVPKHLLDQRYLRHQR